MCSQSAQATSGTRNRVAPTCTRSCVELPNFACILAIKPRPKYILFRKLQEISFPMFQKRRAYALWIVFIALFAAAHAWHLRADFPNFSPWEDWSKYTDEGWYGNAAIRAHLFGNWYIPGDFNPAAAVPVWPFLLWIVFALTGVTLQAARGLAVAFFFLNLFLSYKLFRERSPRWAGLLTVTLLVTSPFLYAFSRLALLEPLLMAFTLAAMNLAIRLPRFRRKEGASALVGLLFTGMLLTKTTAVFLLPALVWIIAMPFWRQKSKLLIRLLVAAGGAAAISFGVWMLGVVSYGLFPDYKYLFFVNNYEKPQGLWPRILSFWWSFHGGLWADRVLVPLAGLLILAALGAALYVRKRSAPRDRQPDSQTDSWTSGLWSDPLFSGSVIAVGGYIAFMTYQNHPQPRYYVVVAFFIFFIVVRVMAQLLYQQKRARLVDARNAGWAILAIVLVTAAVNGVWTLGYVLHPEYTWITAARNLTQYIDEHPSGKRLLVSISGDEITLVSHLPTLCDDFGTQDLPDKLERYQPGWFAGWNDIDPGTLEDLHVHFSLEQVQGFPAFDDPDRNVLYLFKLHPLPNGEVRDQIKMNLQVVLPGDKINIPVE
jgi:4-amino-4-deoxy-L-arabinose transferase-like glycosyltransferase